MSRDDAEAPANVLLLTPDGPPGDCLTQFDSGSTAVDSVIRVEFGGPQESLERLPTTLEGSATELTVISVGTPASQTEPATATSVDPDSVVHVDRPDDLTGLGIAITKAIGEASPQHRSIGLCVSDVAPLLAANETDRVFRFLHLLTRRVRAADGRAHYHLDTTDHGERLVHTLAPVFDAVVDGDAV